MKTLIIAALSSIMLSGCLVTVPTIPAQVLPADSHNPTALVGPKYEQFQEPTRDSIAVHVQWEEDPTDRCVSYGIKTIDGARIHGCAVLVGKIKCTFIVKRPRDFNDPQRLATLGHEFFHCLGAGHQDFIQLPPSSAPLGLTSEPAPVDTNKQADEPKAESTEEVPAEVPVNKEPEVTEPAPKKPWSLRNLFTNAQ